MIPPKRYFMAASLYLPTMARSREGRGPIQINCGEKTKNAVYI
jgi:hypothetical protein